MTFMQGIMWALSVVVALFVGGYLKSYMTKKGKNLATKEDIDKLTRVQEEIKKELLENTWSKQRHWELQRDTALEIMRAYGTQLEASYGLFRVATKRSSSALRQSIVDVDGDQVEAEWDTASSKFQEGLIIFWQLEQIAGLVFIPDIFDQLTIVREAFTDLRAQMYEDTSKFFPLHKALEEKQKQLSQALKVELRI